MKKLILASAMTLVLSACGGSKKTEEVAAPPQAQQQEGGPYTVDFDPNSGVYHHAFKMPIAQGEGKVEYLVTTPLTSTLQLMGTVIKVTGCPAEQVVHQIMWMPDSSKNEGYYVRIGTLFTTLGGTQGKVMHIIHGLANCTDIELSTDLLKLN